MENIDMYVITKEKHNKEDLVKLLTEHPEIKFVSMMGIDLSGNDTDEKIPVKVFLESMDTFLNGVAIQTDGSSVALPGIATLNDAKVDMIIDKECNWFVDYNYDFIDEQEKKPVGTLKIPCFLLHNGNAVDSRSILKEAVETVKNTVLSLIKRYPDVLTIYSIEPEEIDDVLVTCATELEFWVKTPNDKAEIEALTASEVLQEQYWTKTKGPVRTALEQCLILMEEYGFEPEMGHKEVGGVKATLDQNGKYSHVMEQLEVDWKYSDAIQAGDNVIFIRNLIQEVFIRNGLETTFYAKPIDDVAGDGMHVHLNILLKLKNGKKINIFNGPEKHFLSSIGYGALMGFLKNYEVINPFISCTYDSIKRLKPGFEAPVCIVTSLGFSPEIPSRNRTVLIGLIKDKASLKATRFELRSPNPYTNPYITVAVSYLAMLDGIRYAVKNEKTEDELLAELSKKPDEEYDYLEQGRQYRSEEDVFEFYTEEQREGYFGKAPKTVYENLKSLERYPKKVNVLKFNNVLNDKLIHSFELSSLTRWKMEITKRLLNNYINEIRECKMIHYTDKALDIDVANWMKVSELRKYLCKDSGESKSLFTRLKEAFQEDNYEQASALQIELEEKMEQLRYWYTKYKKNLLDV